MFDKFRKKKATHQNAQRNGDRLGYLGVTANLKDGKISFNTKVRGSFESFESNEIIVEILKLKELLEKENKNNSDSDFSTRNIK